MICNAGSCTRLGTYHRLVDPTKRDQESPWGHAPLASHFPLDSRPDSTVYTRPVTQSWLRIGDVARRAGVSIGTIRYYEKRKLLPPSPRSEGGFRLFAVETIERVRFIKQGQEIGFSLDEIRTLLTGGGVEACIQMRDLLQAKLQEIGERMKGLRAFGRTLSRHLQACEKELARQGAAAKCPVSLEIDRAAKQGIKK